MRPRTGKAKDLVVPFQAQALAQVGAADPPLQGP